MWKRYDKISLPQRQRLKFVTPSQSGKGVGVSTTESEGHTSLSENEDLNKSHYVVFASK